MMRLLFLLVLGCLTNLVSTAQLLWKVSSDMGQNIYLFGTMHVSAGNYLNEHPRIGTIAQTCDVVYVEANIDNPEIQNLIMDYIVLPDSISLSDSITDEEWEQLDSTFYALSGNPALTMDGLNRFKPMYVQILLTYLAMAKSDTLTNRENEGSVDRKIMELARQKHKELRYLETAEEQLTMLLNQPLGRQFALLREGLNKDSQSKTGLGGVSKIIQYYKLQQLDSLDQMLKEQAGSSSSSIAMYDELLRERNEKWVQVILNESRIGRNTAFIAVGAAHLVGNEGLISLLRKQGFTVEPVPFE